MNCVFLSVCLSLCVCIQIQRIKLEKIVTEAESEQRDRAERPFTTPERVLMSSQADNRGEGDDHQRERSQE